MVIMLATGPKGHGLKPSQKQWIFEEDKKSIVRLPLEGK
jgi:hypothetical protein